MAIDVSQDPEALHPQNLAGALTMVKAFPYKCVYDFIDFISRGVESIHQMGPSRTSVIWDFLWEMGCVPGATCSQDTFA